MKKIMLFAAVAAMLAGCSEDPVDNGNQPLDPQKYITVETSTQPFTGNATRATLIDNTNISSLALFCAYTVQTPYTETDTPNYMFNAELTRDASVTDPGAYNAWQYVGDPFEWWADPSGNVSAADCYTFFAYSPFATATNGLTVTSTATTPGIPTISYKAPADVADQPDLLFAEPRTDIHPSGHPVSLSLFHALTAVGFEVQGNGEKVLGITISGVKDKGDATIDGSNIAWTNVVASATDLDFSTSIAFDANQNYYTATSTMTNLLAADGYLMFPPQDFAGSDATITITFQNPWDDTTSQRIIKMADFPAWVAGQKVIYQIILTPMGTVTVTPDQIVLPAAAQTPAAQTLAITYTPYGGGLEDPDPSKGVWSLTSNAAWLTLSTEQGGTGAPTVNGEGTKTVYLTATDNSASTNIRTAQLTLNGTSEVVCTVVQNIDPANTGTTTLTANTYTGAFWRANQTGERVIRIGNMPAGTPYTAIVSAYDGQWSSGNDGIVFSTTPSTDANLYTDTPDDAEAHPITDGTLLATGTVDADGIINFRLAPQSAFTAFNAETAPARYAVVLLNANGKTQRLFVRQGEGDDFLMRPEDPSTTSDFNSPARPAARRFSPFNLTAEVLNAPVSINGATPAADESMAGFTQYPSQAGALWQWANADHPRFAWSPVGAVSGWSSIDPTGWWDTIAATYESCPAGYHRPSAGRLNTGTLVPASDLPIAELQQSLYYEVKRGDTESTSKSLVNSIWGYYADGWFDRRPIVASATGAAASTVAPDGGEIAYIGRLLFNPNNNASLFFPGAGQRSNNPADPTGAIRTDGTGASYWTSSCTSDNTRLGISIGFSATTMNMGCNLRSIARLIRCVHN